VRVFAHHALAEEIARQRRLRPACLLFAFLRALDQLLNISGIDEQPADTPLVSSESHNG
jgi:hypothetical protein